MQGIRESRQLVVWCVLAAGTYTALAQNTQRTVMLDMQTPQGAALTDVQVSYLNIDGDALKARSFGDGTAVLDRVGEKATLMLEHPLFGQQTVELRLPDAPKIVVLVEMDGNGARAKVVTSFIQEALPPRAPAVFNAGAAIPFTEGPGGSDSCGAAEAISGIGSFNFSTVGATTEGPNHVACDFFGNDQIFNDVWFCWTSDVDGSVRIETCGGTSLDTKMAVYDGCVCPPTDADLLACNDDDCSLQSGVDVTVVSGQTYLIRVGSFSSTASGSGTLTISGGSTGGGGADDCSAAEPISGEGAFDFDTTTATTDGLAHPACDFFGNDTIFNDVWFLWTAEADGATTIETCGGTALDTKLAVYNAAACPPGDADLIDCNDDNCALQSGVTITATNGDQYLIRLGSFSGADSGVGTLTISTGGAGPCNPASCTTGVGCQIPDQQGHGGGGTLAATSDLNPAANFSVADDFEVMDTGSITAVCWWGIYIDFGPPLTDCAPGTGDDFSITYYNNDNGFVPGTLRAGPFSVTLDNKFETGCTLSGGGITIAEWQFEASHPAVAVTAGECLWIEIVNNTTGTCFWLWDTTPDGDGRSAQSTPPPNFAQTDYDMAFCLDIATNPVPACGPPPATNDNCPDADVVVGLGTFPFDNSSASQDGPPHAACLAFGADQIDNDVWFAWTAPVSGDAIVETCDLTTVDTKMAMYSGTACPVDDARLLACNDDTCGLQSSLRVPVLAGQDYLIRLGTFPGAGGGVGSFTIDVVGGIDNDNCAGAIAVDIPSQTPGTTVNATVDDGLPFCGTSVTSPGVWYTVVGTGTTITASLCDGNTSFDSKLSAYCAVDCSDLTTATCVTGNDDTCGLQSEITWCSQAGAVYYILVHGFGGQTGTFELDITEDGVPCTADVACLPTGACCLNGDCLGTITEGECDALGGQWSEGESCEGGLAIGVGGDAFEDISGTGTPLTLGDDDGQFVPIGFTFNFFGDDHTAVAVTSNGYLTFSPDDLTDFSNDPIPTTFTPNDMIAVLWDDLNPSSGGTVHHQTLGTAPNRRFIAQWTDVPQFGNSDMNTFEAVLFEAGSQIELRYGTISAEGFAGDYTVGFENQDGTDGVSVPGADLGSGNTSLAGGPTPGFECPRCDTCPPGTMPITDADGDFSGWCASISQPDRIAIFVDEVIPGQLALLEISKDFLDGPSIGDFFITPMLIDFVQACPDDLTVPMIFIADESITNQTGTDWVDFHWILFDGPESWFDVAASAGFDTTPFGSAMFEDFIGENRAKTLNASGGTVPNGTSFFPGNGTGELKIGVDLSGADPLSFTLKERPSVSGVLDLSVNSNVGNVPIDVSPVDIYGSGSGEASFMRFYLPDSVVSLTAPATMGDRVFVGWKVDGVMVRGSRTVEVQITQGKRTRAVYRSSAPEPKKLGRVRP